MTKLGVTVSADTSGFIAAMAAAKRELTGLASAAKTQASAASKSFAGIRQAFKEGFQGEIARFRAGSGGALAQTTKDANQLRGSIGGVGTALRGLLGPIASVATAFAAIRLSDDLTNLQARLKLATNSATEAETAFTALFDVAQSRGGSLRDLGDLYVRLGLATKDAGVSQGALLNVTSAVADAVLVAGGNVETANAALIQFAQGLASNRLSGDELRSILEQLPPLADAIAKGMGVTRGELRKLGEDNKLTTQVVLKAVLSQQAALEEQARSIPLTFGRAFQKLKNAALTLVEPFQEAFSTISTVIGNFADFLSSDAVFGTVTEFTTQVGIVFSQMKDDAIEALRVLSEYLDVVATNIGNDLRTLFGIFDDSGASFDRFSDGAKKSANDAIGFYKNIVPNIRTFLKLITIEFVTLFDGLLALGTYFVDAFKAIFSDDTADAAAKRYRAALDRIIKQKEESVALTLQEHDTTLETAKLAAETARAEREGRRQNAAFQRTQVRTGGGRPTRSAAELAKAKALAEAKLDAEEKLIKDATERSVQQIELFHDRALISTLGYIDERTRIELKGIDDLIAVEQKRGALGAKEAEKANAEIALLERKKTDIRAKGETDRLKLEQEAAKQTRDLQLRGMELSGQDTEAANARLDDQLEEIVELFRQAGDEAGEAFARSVFGKEKLKNEFDKVKGQFDKALAELNSREQSLANQRITGAISDATAEAQVREARQASIAILSEHAAKLREYADANRDNAQAQTDAVNAELALQRKIIDSATGLEAATQSLRDQLANLRDSFASDAANAGVSAFSDFLVSIADRTKSASEKLKDFVRSFGQSMAQIVARLIATAAVLQVLNLIPGFAAVSSAASGISVTAGNRHRGGMVGHGGAKRVVDASWFAAAPRFHNGGLAGIKPNEVPTILQKGEEVLTQNDPRHAANGGGAGTSVRIINAIEPENIQKAMSNPGGDKVIINAIRSNAGAVKQLLREF